jgi:hypothetical protein
MRLPRFKVRTLLILVILAGSGVGGYVLWGRSVEYRRRAESARSFEMEYADQASGFRSGADAMSHMLENFSIFRPSPLSPEQVAAVEGAASLPPLPPSLEETRAAVDDSRRRATECDRMRDYNAGIKLKYYRAARYPWLPVEPDPPEPE